MKTLESAKASLAKIFANIGKQNSSNIKKIVKILEQINQMMYKNEQNWEDVYYEIEAMAHENGAERELSAAILISSYGWSEEKIMKCLDWSKKILLSHHNGTGNSQYIQNLRSYYAKTDKKTEKSKLAQANTIGEIIRDIPVVVFSGEKRKNAERVCQFVQLSERDKKTILNTDGYFDWLPKQKQNIREAESFRTCKHSVVVSVGKTSIRIENKMLYEIFSKKMQEKILTV